MAELLPDFGRGPGRPPGSLNRVADTGVGEYFLTNCPGALPHEARLKEKFWHRAAAYMFAAGNPPKKIAEALGVGVDSVRQLSRNVWFQEVVLFLMRENGAQDIMDLFKSEQVNSFLTLVDIRDDVKAPTSVRRQAAMDIIQQVMGKPTQRTEVVGVVKSSDPVAEAERLERENAALRREAQPLN